MFHGARTEDVDAAARAVIRKVLDSLADAYGRERGRQVLIGVGYSMGEVCCYFACYPTLDVSLLSQFFLTFDSQVQSSSPTTSVALELIVVRMYPNYFVHCHAFFLFPKTGCIFLPRYRSA